MAQKKIALWKQFFQCYIIFSCLFFLWVISTKSIFGQDTDWNIEELIGLPAGICIREGPGLNYQAHTRVPEDNWTVMVIGGPRQTGGKTWYNTSRNAAGDLSGGTGWVMADWSDRNCNLPVLPPQPQPEPNSATSPTLNIFQQTHLSWNGQSPVMKWIVALIIVASLILIWRQAGSHIVSLIPAIITSLFLIWLTDSFREIWQEPWQNFVGAGAPDFALLVGTIPLVSWLLNLFRRFQIN